MNAPAKVDVLAVLDAVQSELYGVARAEGNPAVANARDESARKVFEVRAAVAELIEACKARDLADGLAVTADINNSHGLRPEEARAAHVALTEANLRYYAALARIEKDLA